MSFEILSKPVRTIGADLRRGVRLVSRRWSRIDRATRSRIELAAVFSLLPLSAAIAAIAAVPSVLDLDAVESRPIVESIETPSLVPSVAPAATPTEAFIREARVQRGETVATLLRRLGVDDDAALRFILSSPSARTLVRVVPGRFVQVELDADGRLRRLRLFNDEGTEATASIARVFTLTAAPDAVAGFAVVEEDVLLDRQVALRSGEIQESLFGAADAAGVPDSIAQQIVVALESQIDFHRNLQKGDTFRVVYETFHSSGEYVRPGRLLAVEFNSGSNRYDAYWFPDGSKNGGYYALDGQSMQRGFLRSPLEYTRVSSGFTSSRAHPLYGYDAAHRGIDYSASAGAKVRAIAAGVIEVAGWQSGYGNVVEVRHDARHSTLYAHLSAFGPGLVKNARVAQGDLLGLVGSTGWATGPHLHFELKVNGNTVNPLTATLPAAIPLPAHLMPALEASAAPMREHLALLERIRIASAGR